MATSYYADRMIQRRAIVMTAGLSAGLINIQVQGTCYFVLGIIGLGGRLMAITAILQEMMRVVLS